MKWPKDLVVVRGVRFLLNATDYYSKYVMIFWVDVLGFVLWLNYF